MKKKILSLLLSVALMAGMLAVPTSAATTVTESDLALATLQSMGVVDATTPSLTSGLTRAQFADMIIKITDNTSLLTTVSTRSLFSDVTSSYWATSQINLAYQLGYMNGNGDGTFSPDRTITLGEAVTTVLRVLGYTSTDIGYVWPTDYISAAQSMGLLDDIDTTASTFTYGDGISLLATMLVTETSAGKDYMDGLGASSVSDVFILSNDETNGTATDQLYVYSSSGFSYYTQAIEIPDDLVMSCRGTLLTDSSGEVCGFIPNDETRVTINMTDVDASGVYDEYDTLTMVSSSATLILNDSKTTFGTSYYELDMYDMVILCYGNTGTVELVIPLSGTSTDGYVITGYYEGASPNFSQPETVTVAGYTFDVDEDIAYRFSAFAYGDKIHITLDENSDVVGVSAYSSYLDEDMIGIINGDTVTLTCGITLSGTISTSASDGDLVRVFAYSQTTLKAYVASASTPGAFDITNMTLGDYTVASDVLIYEGINGHAANKIYLSSIDVDVIDRTSVDYYHLNDDGEVDIILLDDVTGDLYTYGVITVGTISTSSGTFTVTNKSLAIENGDGTTKAAQDNSLAIYDGEYGGLVLDADGDVAGTVLLTSAGEASLIAFDGDDTVVVDGVRYNIDADVQVYSEITDSWVTTLAVAKTYNTTFECYYDRSPDLGGKIRVIVAS